MKKPIRNCRKCHVNKAKKCHWRNVLDARQVRHCVYGTKIIKVVSGGQTVKYKWGGACATCGRSKDHAGPDMANAHCRQCLASPQPAAGKYFMLWGPRQ